MSSFVKTADLVDAHDALVRFCHLPFRRFGARPGFSGVVRTVRTFEDNTLVRACLETEGQGRVLVVDGAGSTRVALVGDQLAALGRDHGWAGMVVNGAIRDASEIGAMDFAVLALGTSPKKSAKGGYGELDVPVSFGGITIAPGNVLYADDDGVLVADRELTRPA
jgi:regulator of ribonuclease activity A